MDYGLIYIQQDDVVINFDFDDLFFGLCFLYDYFNKLIDMIEFMLVFIVDQNLDDIDDLCVDFINVVVVLMMECLVFKVSLQLFYDNMLVFVVVDVVNVVGELIGDSVFVEFEDFDSFFMLVFVVNF